MRFDSIEKYSIFAINNLNMKNADCEGNMAVGKNITLENFSIGIGYAPNNLSQYSDSLVVGGTVNIKNCVNYSGNTIIQKNRYPKNYKMSTPKGSVLLKKVLDFQECYNLLKDSSTRLAQKNSNALVERIDENTYELISVFKNEIQVFNLELNETNIDEINIYLMVDNKSPIIINVNSGKLHLKNINVYFNNQLCSEVVCSRILWNFYKAEEIIIRDSKFYGTILGVDSGIYLKNSTLYGSIYARDIFGDSDVLLCRLDIALCRYLSDMQNYRYENPNGGSVKLKNKFIDQYYTQSNTITSSKSNSITSQSTKTKEKTKATHIPITKRSITRNEENNIKDKATIKKNLISKGVGESDFDEIYYKNKLLKESDYEIKVEKNFSNNEELLKIKEIDIKKFEENKLKISENIGSVVLDERKTKVSPICFEKNLSRKDFDDEIILSMLNSISHEEEGIAEILRAEAFKIKKSVELAQTVEDYIKLDNSLGKTVRGLNSLQSLLLYKFEEVIKICDKD